MEMMAKTGVASGSCLPYYIGGEGTEHFEHHTTAPPCETHCQGGYDISLANDTFSSADVGNYNWLTSVYGDAEKIRITKQAILEEGPVAFAFFANRAFMSYASGVFSVSGHERANHAVYMFGWGLAQVEGGADVVEYMEASNSWGPDWGNGGHFRIHPRCVTDVTIPGPIASSAVNHEVGTVDPSVPKDDTNPSWPWKQPDECPSTDDGCVTDPGGPEPYSDNQECVSHMLDNKRIRIVEFDTELHYDILTVNGMDFSGKEGNGLDVATLSDMTVDEHGLKFKSDFSETASGFKICEL